MDELVEMAVESVRVHALSSNHVVILKELHRERYLPIWIGPWEASAIATRLQGATPERPLTHDLFASTLAELGAEVRRVVIADLSDETFLARLQIVVGGHEHDIDARPSDALAIAVRTGAPVFAARGVIDRAGVEPAEERSTTSSDEGLEVFREFVNSLDIDLGPDRREGRGSD